MTHTVGNYFRFPNVDNTSSSGNPIQFGFQCVGGSTVLILGVIFIGSTRSGGSPNFVVGGVSGTFTLAESRTGVEATAELWYLLSPTTGISGTVVVPNSGGAASKIWAICGAAQDGWSSELDVAVGTGSIATNPNVTIITRSPGDFIFGVVATGAQNFTTAVPSGTALFVSEDVGAWGGAAQYFLQNVSGSYVTRWTFGTSDDYGIVSAAFREYLAASVGHTGSSTLSALSNLTPIGTKYVDGLFKGNEIFSFLDISGTKFSDGSTSLNATSNLSVSANRLIDASATLNATSYSSSGAAAFALGTATLNALSQFVPSGGLLINGSCTFCQVGTVISGIIDINHEDGTFSEYDTTVTDGGDLSVTGSAALAGTNYGMQIVLNDTTVIYGEANVTGSNTGIYRGRFYINLNTLSFGAINHGVLMHFVRNITGQNLSYIRLARTASFYYTLQSYIFNDSGVPSIGSGSSVELPSGEHWIEYLIVKATSDVASDGYMQWWIDDVEQVGRGGVDLYDRYTGIGSIRLGAPQLASTPSGTFYLDEYVLNDTGEYIGPVSAGGGCVSSFLNVTATKLHSGASTFVGTSNLLVSGNKFSDGSSTLNPSSYLDSTATGGTIHSGSATLDALSNLSVSANRMVDASATLDALSNLSISASAYRNGSSTLDALSNLSLSVVAYRNGLSTLQNLSELLVSGIAYRNGSATLDALSNLSVSANRIVDGSTTLSATSNLSISGSVYKNASATLDALSNITISGLAYRNASATLNADSNLSVSASGALIHSGNATLSSVSSLVVSGVQSISGNATLNALSNLSVVASKISQGSATLDALSNLSISALAIRGTSATLNALSNLSVSANIQLGGLATLQGLSNLVCTASGAIVHNGSSTLVNVSSLVSSSVAFRNGSSTLNADSNLSVSALKILDGNSTLSGESLLSCAGAITFGGSVDLDALSYISVATVSIHGGSATLVGLSELLVYAGFTMSVPTPACRTYDIEFDDRIYSIPREDREYIIEYEDRVFDVTCPS